MPKAAAATNSVFFLSHPNLLYAALGMDRTLLDVRATATQQQLGTWSLPRLAMFPQSMDLAAPQHSNLSATCPGMPCIIIFEVILHLLLKVLTELCSHLVSKNIAWMAMDN